MHQLVMAMSDEEALRFDEAFWRFVETNLTRAIEPFVKLEAKSLSGVASRTASFDCPDAMRRFVVYHATNILDPEQAEELENGMAGGTAGR